MNRIVNNPDFVVEDMLKGFVKTHKDIVSIFLLSTLVRCRYRHHPKTRYYLVG